MITVQQEPVELKNGLYIIYWKDSEGSSEAAVGSDYYGSKWYAPTNWIGGAPCFDWSRVDKVERLVVSTTPTGEHKISEEASPPLTQRKGM